jgi:glutamine---fructose-6-phosphate transaminase (isomerizing)
MCGIVGYLGTQTAVPLMIEGLRQLEYRGYDSAGVAFLNDENVLEVYKASGKLVNLENILPAHALSHTAANVGIGSTLPANVAAVTPNGVDMGIGHIRWATHGLPNDVNAHPHVSHNGNIALVHNGIIENFYDLRQELQAEGFVFVSETDTECIAHLLESIQKTESDFKQVIAKAIARMRGAYALVIINKQLPNQLFAVRHQAPLVIGLGKQAPNANEFWVASDAVAIAKHTQKIIYLKDHEIAALSVDGLVLTTLEGQPVQPVVEVINSDPLTVDKKGFKHFMMKEIHEQPDVVRNSLANRLLGAELPIQLFPKTSAMQVAFNHRMPSINRVMIIGCGSSYNAGLVGKYFIEELVRIPVEVEAAGECRYRNPILDENTLVIAISQSGETADTLEAMRQAQRRGASILAVTNREDSTLAREATFMLPVRAGIEVSVCASKSFLAQCLVFFLLGIAMAEQQGGEQRQSATPDTLTELKAELLKIPAKIEAVLANLEPLQAVSKKYKSARDIIFIARGINFPVAMEGALKLKEISYIHAEGYSGSELKHGPIALLDENVPVISVLTPGVVFDKMISNCQEAKARDARVVGICSVVDANGTPPAEMGSTFEDVVTIPDSPELISPLITIIPLQLIAYYMADYLGKDVDQPRNLAKSVTVE